MKDNPRVLIVDDDFHVARLHATYVNAAPGYTALEPVGSGGAALEAIQTYRPDLILIDIYLRRPSPLGDGDSGPRRAGPHPGGPDGHRCFSRCRHFPRHGSTVPDGAGRRWVNRGEPPLRNDRAARTPVLGICLAEVRPQMRNWLPVSVLQYG